jgi:hypothetical protein
MATATDLQNTLNSLGLGFLYNLLENSVLPDPTIDANDTDTIVKLIQTNPETVEAYNNRFIGNQFRKNNGLKELTPLEYIRAEREYIDTLRNTGMPVGFYDQPQDLARFIGADISRVELEGRVVRGYRAASQADAATKQQLQQLYGIDEADLAAYYLDPTRAADVMGRKKDAALFSRQMAAAGVAGQATTQADIRLNLGQAEDLAAQGVDTTTARQGFGAIAQQRGLFEAQMAGEDVIGQEEQIAAAFGTSAAAAQRVATRRRRRQAEFEAGGGIVAGQTGVAGLRTANQ